MDRRRINGPSGGTSQQAFLKTSSTEPHEYTGPQRSRESNALRKMFLKTGVTPSASGSAYLELEPSQSRDSATPTLSSLSVSGLKLACTVHGPRPLPKSAPFSPHIILTTHVKYAPFASRKRRGYIRDASEKDLSVHLETALRGVIIGSRWPKSGVEVVITVLEGEEDRWWGGDAAARSGSLDGGWGMMNILGGCITVASAAIVDAGIDCVDMASGGVAAIVRNRSAGEKPSAPELVLDPVPSEHQEVLAACFVSYLPARDEVTDIWVRGDLMTDESQESTASSYSYQTLMDNAVQAALATHSVLTASLRESAEIKLQRG